MRFSLTFYVGDYLFSLKQINVELITFVLSLLISLLLNYLYSDCDHLIFRLTENVGESQYKFEIWFRRRTDGATRTLQAPNMDVKAAWVREISRLLWKQAIKNRGK